MAVGELWSRSISGKYIVGKASGPRHLLLGSGRSRGEVSPAMGGREGEPGLRGKAPFPSAEKHVIYTEKEQEIMAGRWEAEGGGVNSCSEGFSGGRGKTERRRICSRLARSRLRATRVSPVSSADNCCYFFFFHMVQGKKKLVKLGLGLEPLDLVK